MQSQHANRSADTLTTLFQAGFVAIPQLLFKQYRRMGLSDAELLLLVHIMAFRDGDHNEFPTFRDLSERMAQSEADIIAQVHRLIESGYLRIDVRTGPTDGRMSESYDLTPLYYRLAQSVTEPDHSVFVAFESEFGRPLSSMEYEQIVHWIDHDRHSDPVILAALKEAVLAGKCNFKYIDRILLDWQKNNVRSLRDVETHRERFRAQSQQAAASELTPNTRRRSQPAVSTPSNKYDAFYQKLPSRDPR